MKYSTNPIPFLLIIVLMAFSMSYRYIQSYSSSEYYVGTIDGYDLSKPVSTFKLPKILHEISGLTDIDNHTVACVQDEEGIVFIYDLEKEEIKNQFQFGEAGDYEGITRVGNSLYILRSDGKLFEIDNFKTKDFKVVEYNIDIPTKDNEGLAYDPQNNKLLIGGKSEPKGKEYKGKRIVFAFDLATKSLIENPVYEFSESLIKEFVVENIKDLDEKVKDLKVQINPSALAVHPITGKLFVLSSKGKTIYIFNKNSQVEAVHYLPKKIFSQPEGITFLDNGDMFISNEGKNGQPSLLRFDYQK